MNFEAETIPEHDSTTPAVCYAAKWYEMKLEIIIPTLQMKINKTIYNIRF